MNRIFTILVFCNAILSIEAHAQTEMPTYHLSQASTLERLCSLNKSNAYHVSCLSYVTAISDIYFLQNPQCRRPDALTFNEKVFQNIKSIIDSIPVAKRETEYAASVVFQAVSLANPCQKNTVVKSPDKNVCQKGIAELENQWVNSYQKQALLEILRNRGCLN